MATLENIGKARATGLVMAAALGVEPSYEHHDNYIRLYYPPESLPSVRAKIDEMITGPAGDVRIDFGPMLTPFAVRKVLPIAAGLLIGGILLGRMTKQ